MCVCVCECVCTRAFFVHRSRPSVQRSRKSLRDTCTKERQSSRHVAATATFVVAVLLRVVPPVLLLRLELLMVAVLLRPRIAASLKALAFVTVLTSYACAYIAALGQQRRTLFVERPSIASFAAAPSPMMLIFVITLLVPNKGFARHNGGQ